MTVRKLTLPLGQITYWPNQLTRPTPPCKLKTLESNTNWVQKTSWATCPELSVHYRSILNFLFYSKIHNANKNMFLNCQRAKHWYSHSTFIKFLAKLIFSIRISPKTNYLYCLVRANYGYCFAVNVHVILAFTKTISGPIWRQKLFQISPVIFQIL